LTTSTTIIRSFERTLVYMELNDMLQILYKRICRLELGCVFRHLKISHKLCVYCLWYCNQLEDHSREGSDFVNH